MLKEIQRAKAFFEYLSVIREAYSNINYSNQNE